MNMDQIFNELSADGSYSSREDAEKGLMRLADVSGEMVNIGFSPILRTTENFSSLELCPGFTIHKCILKNIKDPRAKLFLDYATKSPYVNDILDSRQKGILSEFSYKSKEVFGLALAFMNNIPALSLSCFPEGRINLEHTILNADKSLSIKTVNAETISSIEMFIQCRDFLQNAVWNCIKNGIDLIEQFARLFLSLYLSRHAQENIASLNGNEEFFREFIRHFAVLNETARQWKKGIRFKPEGIDFSNETKRTLEEYRDEHTFTCCDGEARLFSAHSKIKSANQRIYFFHDAATNIVHIGHAGKHLHTAKYHN